MYLVLLSNYSYICLQVYSVYLMSIKQRALIKLMTLSSHTVFSYLQQNILNVVENFAKITTVR